MKTDIDRTTIVKDTHISFRLSVQVVKLRVSPYSEHSSFDPCYRLLESPDLHKFSE